MNKKDEIIKFSKKIDIDLIGFTNSNGLIEIESRINKRIDKKYLSEFDSNDINQKINPKLYLEDCKSIIVIGIKYKFSNDVISENYGRLSSIAIGVDYHKIVTKKLNELVEFIKTLYSNVNYKICVDTCNLADRQIAYKAGIGEYGKNNFIISKEYGSAINIGYILIDKKFEDNKLVVLEGCKSCKSCIEACPTKALTEDGLDARKCISELTQTKRELTYLERELIGDRIYGCDICQKICPKNIKVNYETIVDSSIDLFDLISLSNREFKEKYENSAFFWRGNNIIKRNAIIALGNYKNKRFFDDIKLLLKHQSDTIRECALWALFKSDSKRFLNIFGLDEKLMIEKSKIVKYYSKVNEGEL